MEDKNYYMEEEIGDSGVASTRNPYFQSQGYNPLRPKLPNMNVGRYFDDNSKYDENLGDIEGAVERGLTVDDLRADKQSGWNMLGSAVANNLVIAGTTAVGGVIGLVDGLVEAVATSDVSKLWDNTVNNAVVDIQNAAREAMPIYRGKEYQDKSIWGKMGTGIFWADLFENLGFTEGMLIPGLGVSSLLSKAPKIAQKMLPSLVSAIGEASIEAVNLRNDEVENKTAIARQEYNDYAASAKSNLQLSLLENEYINTVQSIEEDARKAGNFGFAANIALLTLTNTVEFGELFSRGAGTGKRLSRFLTRNGDTLEVEGLFPAMAKTAGKKLVDAASEGFEETAQNYITKVPSNYTDYNSFNRSMFNPEKLELAANLWSAMGKSVADALNDPNMAEEFMSGVLIGLIGVPTLSRKTGIALENNVIGELYDTYKDVREAQELATQIQDREIGDKQRVYYEGLVRRLAIQDDKNAAIDSEDTYNFNTAASAGLISDVMMYDEAGDIDYLKSIVNDSVDLSDEGIQAIIEETSKDGEGPFMQNGNPLSAGEVRDIIKKKQDAINTLIDNYVKDKEALQKSFPKIDDPTLKNALFLKQQIVDHTKRHNELSEEILNGFKTLFESIPESKIPTDKDGKAIFDSSFTKRELLEALSDKGRASSLIKALIDDSSLMPYDERADLILKINDLGRLSSGINKMNKSLKEILEDPFKSSNDLNAVKEEETKRATDSKKQSLVDSLNNAESLSDFRSLLESESDPIVIGEALDTLEANGNPMAKAYRDIDTYNSSVSRAINSLDESTQVKEDAAKLLQNQFDNASTIEEMANPNSVHINDENILYDDSLTPEENNKRFIDAQYALLTAMSQVDKANKFKSGFSNSYRKLEEKGNPNPSAPVKDTTGDSGTSTIPPISTNDLPLDISEVPVGDIASYQVSDENAQANGEVVTQQSLDSKAPGKRPYYRPAIPELHIEASKGGDFRPFNEVVAEEGLDFNTIYNYLKNNGAFDYVNRGNLKSGDKVRFMIDPAFEEMVKGAPWHTQPTIFLVTESGQIIGSLDESQYTVDKYEGLKELEERVRDEFAKSDKTKRFIATPVTRVSQIMIGKIPYGTQERSLKDIPNVSGDGVVPIFGIVKNGTLFTNGKLDDNLVIKPVDMSQKEGRLYLLIPNAAGKYSPAAVRVKHFNIEEFDPDDVINKHSPVGISISEAIELMANAESDIDVSDAVGQLKQYLYTGDIHIDWFESPNGNGIRFTKVQRNVYGEEIYDEKDGKRVRREDSRVVFTTEKWDPNTVYSIGEDGQIQTSPERRSVEDITREITGILLRFNLPIQVNSGMINRGTYNKMLVNSGVLTSNISDARVISSWFTTDYFDVDGNIHRSVDPKSAPPSTTRSNSPVGGVESSIPGIQVTNPDGITLYVDLDNGTARDAMGKPITLPEEARWEAFAQSVYGDSSNGAFMVNNKLLLPDGRVFDREKYHIYDTDSKEAQEVRNKIANRGAVEESTKAVISKIADNQAKVDKTRTDSEFYYILEEDGQYHEYERVHSKLGSNWVESKKQSDALRDIRVKLSQFADNPTQFNSYLNSLGKHYGIDLTSFSNRGDVRSRDTIVNLIRDVMFGTNSQRALDAGTSVDSVIRNFFTSNEAPVRPSNMSEKAFTDLITSLTEIRSNIEARGERFLTNNIVLFQKYQDGTRVAGEVDILSVDSEGNFRIYDVKTSRYSFYDFKDRNGKKVNYFKNKSATQKMSNEEYYTLQLSAYKNLFESQYHVPITTLAVLPFVLNYSNDTVDGVTKEKGIMITYNPSVSVPLVGSVKSKVSTSTDSTTPIFNSALETQDPINNILPEYNISNGKIGYFIRDGKLHKGYLSHIGQVNGVEVYMTKVPNITKGFGKEGDASHVASNSYMVVFPNGNSVTVVPNAPTSYSDSQAKESILKALNGNPQRVIDMANETTSISNSTTTTVAGKQEGKTSTTILSSQELSGAAKMAQASQAVNEHDSEFEDELVLSERKKSQLPFKTVEFILDTVPELVKKYGSKVRVYLRVGYSLKEISNMIGEDLLKLAGYRGVLWDTLSREERVAIVRGYNPTQTSFDQEYSAKGYSMNTEYQVEDIEGLITADLYKSALFNKIIAIAKQFGITIQFKNRALYDTADGLYGYNKIVIQVSPNAPYFQQVLVHELIHSVTQGIINRSGTGELTNEQEQAFRVLEEVYNSVKDKYGKDSWYGLSNVAEFVAELANPEFREFLKNQKLENGSTLWSKIIEFFKRIFGNKLEISEASLEQMLDNPIKDTGKDTLFRKRNRTLLNSNLTANERRFIQDYIMNLGDHLRIKGTANIHNPNTGKFYTVNFSPTIDGHLDNLRQGRDGFEVMDRRGNAKLKNPLRWENINTTTKQRLLDRDITEELWNRVSNIEKEQILKCLAL